MVDLGLEHARSFCVQQIPEREVGGSAAQGMPRDDDIVVILLGVEVPKRCAAPRPAVDKKRA